LVQGALVNKCVEPCIISTKSRKIPQRYCETLYRQRHKAENIPKDKGLTAHRNPLRPMRPHLLLEH